MISIPYILDYLRPFRGVTIRFANRFYSFYDNSTSISSFKKIFKNIFKKSNSLNISYILFYYISIIDIVIID